MNELISLATTYGITSLIIGMIIILLVGVAKFLLQKQLNKLSKENRKVVFEVIVLSLSFGLPAAWKAISVAMFSTTAYLTSSATVIMLVHVMYPLYENFRVRDLVKLFGTFCVKLVAGKKVSHIMDSTLAIDGQALVSVQTLESAHDTDTSREDKELELVQAEIEAGNPERTTDTITVTENSATESNDILSPKAHNVIVL